MLCQIGVKKDKMFTSDQWVVSSDVSVQHTKLRAEGKEFMIGGDKF